MNRKPRMIWTKAQDEFLIENYDLLPKVELMRKLGRSYGAITHRITFLRRKERK